MGEPRVLSPLMALAVGLLVTGCATYVASVGPPSYRADISSSYDRTWTALVQALAKGNVPLRAVARDSGVIASHDMVTTIGLYSDCGKFQNLPVEGSDDPVEGEAFVSFTLFVAPSGDSTRIQINSRMWTHMHRKGGSGKLKVYPVYQCASTGRFELNLLDAVRELVGE